MPLGLSPILLIWGLEEIGVELTERKFIVVEDDMSTSVENVWAIGDVTGELLLAHVASRQGIICAEAIALEEIEPINYLMVPRATYCYPQVASFGLTESQARERFESVKIGKFPLPGHGQSIRPG